VSGDIPDVAFEAISLGFACEVKYQLSRNLYFRQHPTGSEWDFRAMLMTPDYGSRPFERHIFDWQITPFEAVLAYLEADFRGVFEREDLVWAADGSGEVEHRRLKTRHPHDFKPVDGAHDGRAIDLQYEAARAKFEHLAGKFRDLIRQKGAQLFVFRQIRIYDDAVRLLELLNHDGPGRDVRLLFAGYDGEDQHLGALEGKVFKAWAPLRADKAGDRQWEGDDARWDALLAPFRLKLPGDRLPPTFAESQARLVATPPPEQRPSWLASLLRR
jgi:hypothetical protein